MIERRSNRCATSRWTFQASPPTLVALLALALAGLALSYGCSGIKAIKPGPSQTTIFVTCDGRVNDGVLLTLDFVQVNDAEAREINGLVGAEWFYSDLRNSLKLRTETITVSGNCETQLPLLFKKAR